jgi:hypothetical protein
MINILGIMMVFTLLLLLQMVLFLIFDAAILDDRLSDMIRKWFDRRWPADNGEDKA